MNLTRLALKNITGSRFRSWVVALCALLVAAFVLSTTLIIRGAENSLRLANERLGADVIVGVDLNPAREALAKEFGMTHFVNPAEVEGDLAAYIVELTGGGADYSFECIGNTTTMRQALELSTTTQPSLAACGANLSLVPPPAEKRAMSMPLNESSVNSSTAIKSPLNRSFRPTERAEASNLMD